MTQLLIQNAEVLNATGHWPRGWILVDNGRIAAMDEGEPPAIADAERIDGTGKTALPGFIDMHVHGAIGHDTMDATPEALYAVSRFYASHGVTSFLATTMTAESHDIRAALQNIAAHQGPIEGGATLLGAHLEGPYINVKMKGAQPADYVRRARPEEYQAWLDLNVIREVTVAPEFPENQTFIRDCVSRGIVVSVGHTQAMYEDVLTAVSLGAKQTTHTFNAMVGLHHRQPGTVGAAMSCDDLACELIADNFHVHPAVMKILVRAKGLSNLILITDAMAGAGMPDGNYELGSQNVVVREDTATLMDGTLAGSTLTMDRALQNIQRATDLPLAQLWPVSSANAARQLGLSQSKGLLAVGFDADIVLLDQSGQVALTLVAGRMAYAR